jgi:hypothetical protein
MHSLNNAGVTAARLPGPAATMSWITGIVTGSTSTATLLLYLLALFWVSRNGSGAF